MHSACLDYKASDACVAVEIRINGCRYRKRYPIINEHQENFISDTAEPILEAFAEALLFSLPVPETADKILNVHARDSGYLCDLFNEFYTDAFEQYLAGGSLKTAKHISNAVRRLSEFEQQYLKQRIKSNALSQAVLDEYFLYLIRTRKMQRYTAGRMIFQIITLLNKGVRLGLIPPHNLKPVRVTKPPITPVYLNRTELKKISAYVPAEKFQREIQSVFLVMCYTGLDYRSILKLKVTDFDGSRLCIKRRGRKLHIPLIPPIARRMRSMHGPADLLCPQYQINAFNKHINFIASAAGIKKRLSSRSAQLTLAFTLGMPAGMSIETISVLFDHSRVQYTMGKLPLAEYNNTQIMDMINKNRAS